MQTTQQQERALLGGLNVQQRNWLLAYEATTEWQPITESAWDALPQMRVVAGQGEEVLLGRCKSFFDPATKTWSFQFAYRPFALRLRKLLLGSEVGTQDCESSMRPLSQAV
jgi:hypothetical protein